MVSMVWQRGQGKIKLGDADEGRRKGKGEKRGQVRETKRLSNDHQEGSRGIKTGKKTKAKIEKPRAVHDR